MSTKTEVNELIQLADVEIVSPMDGQLLQYVAAEDNWQNGPGGGPGGVASVGGVSPIHSSGGLNPQISLPGISSSLVKALYAVATFTDNVAAVIEKGVTVNAITWNWTYNRNSDNPTAQSLSAPGPGAVAVGLRTANTGAAGKTDTFTTTLSGTGDDTTWGNPVNNPFSQGITHTFVYPFYYGVGAQGLTGAQVGALAKIIQTQQNTTRAFAPVNQVYYFAYPAAYPNLTSIKDGNGFNITADWTLHNPVVITGLDGSPQNYKVYEFNNLNSTSQNLTFTF